jgi:hypothetical protein
MNLRRFVLLIITLAASSVFIVPGNAIAASKKPNILMIMSDDVGIGGLSDTQHRPYRH